MHKKSVQVDSNRAPAGDAAVSDQLTGTPTGTPIDPGATWTTDAGPSTAPRGDAAQAERHGSGVVRRTTNNVKRALLLVVGALAALFAVFNSQNVQVHWIFGSAVNTPLIIVIVIAFVAGGLIGWIAAKLGNRDHTA